MVTTRRWTSADLDVLPDDGKVYEIIDGEIYVSRPPNWGHQFTCGRLFRVLDDWSEATGEGVANLAPGVIFAADDDVAPDVVWVSRQRLATALQPDGRLHEAPDLAVEVLSPGLTNERRDREAKLKLYSQRGVREYWIVNWQRQEVAVYRRQAAWLELVATLLASDTLTSPLLPGFECPVGRLFFEVP